MGDKWIGRYQRLGLDGLKELSRAAKHHPNAIGPSLCQRIVQYKLRHQCFGPKKVMDGLRREDDVTTVTKSISFVSKFRRFEIVR